MIAYKVVEKRTRWCSNWTLFKNGALDEYVKDIEKELRKRFKSFDKWFPRYIKGTIVEAVSGSVGILTFYSREDAELFKKRHTSLKRKAIIIKVEGIGKVKIVKAIRANCGSQPENISRLKKDYDRRAPAGTRAFKAVKVLE